MNTEQYFKDEFQAYPELFREIMVFIEHESCHQGLFHPEKTHFNDALRHVTPCKLPTGNFSISITQGQLPPQKTPVLARWTYLNSRHVDVRTWHSPLLKNELYAKKRQVWNADPSFLPWLVWLVNINLQQSVWALHRQSEDYQLLCEEGKLKVDTVGAAVKLIRKKVVNHLVHNGVDLRDDPVQNMMASLTQKEKTTRLSKARKHLEKLNPDFRDKLFGFLRTA